MGTLKEGDVVKLNSGGEEMTISYVVGNGNHDDMFKLQGFKDGDVVCQWFSGKEVKEKVFKSIVLTQK